MTTPLSDTASPLMTPSGGSLPEAVTSTAQPGEPPSSAWPDPLSPFRFPLAPGAEAGVAAFRAGLAVLRSGLSPYLYQPGVDFSRFGKSFARRARAIPRILDLMRAAPELSPTSPDEIARLTAQATALGILRDGLNALVTEVEDTIRILNAAAWGEAYPVYTAAAVKQATDPRLATAVEAVQAVMAVGRRTDTAVLTEAAASHEASKATARAEAAHQRAQAAAQSRERIVQAHAARHGTPR